MKLAFGITSPNGIEFESFCLVLQIKVLWNCGEFSLHVLVEVANDLKNQTMFAVRNIRLPFLTSIICVKFQQLGIFLVWKKMYG